MWGCSKKYRAREETIIEPYRKYFGYSLPTEKQYWTMCGDCSNDQGTLREGSEPDQLLKSGLIQPQQFHGVEINDAFYSHNKQITNPPLNWYHNDFYQTMVESINRNQFNPGIINADLILMPEKGIPYFSRIMYLLTHNATSVMLVGNLILRNRGMEVHWNNIVSRLEKNSLFQVSVNTGKWKFDDKVYVYNGSGQNKTVLGTIIFRLK